MRRGESSMSLKKKDDGMEKGDLKKKMKAWKLG